MLKNIINQSLYKHIYFLIIGERGPSGRNLGLDLSSAINIFLRQCLIKGGLPFTVEDPHYNKKTLEALVEAKKISRDPNVPSYETMDELKAALESD